MYITIPIDKINQSGFFYNTPIINTIITYGLFIRLIYSDEHFTTLGINVSFNIRLNNIFRSYGKYKCNFDHLINNDVKEKLIQLEHLILSNNNSSKTRVLKLSETLKSGRIIIMNHIEQTYNTNMFILKIYGLWETDTEIGLTYKLIGV